MADQLMISGGGLSPLDNMPLSHAGGLLKTDEQLPSLIYTSI
jgi:hypothetical protein